MSEEIKRTSNRSVERTVALLIVTSSVLWILLEQISLGKLLPHAISFSFGFLGVIFVISAAIGIVLGFIKRTSSVAYITFSVTYLLLLLGIKLLPALVVSFTS